MFQFIQISIMLFALIYGYITVKNTKKEAKQAINSLIPTLLDEKNVNLLLQSLINNEKYQKFLYESGAIAGQGAKSAFGGAFNAGKGGKGLFGQIIGGVIETFTKPGQNAQPTAETAQSKGLKSDIPSM